MFEIFVGKIFVLKYFRGLIGQAIVAAGTLDESHPFGSGKPSLCCRYRSRAILAVLSCVAFTYT